MRNYSLLSSPPQQVNTGSIADNAGLKAGDAVVRLNATDLYNLRHKDAQDAIVKAGPSFELVIQRFVHFTSSLRTFRYRTL